MKTIRMKRNYSNLFLTLIAMLILVGCSNSSVTSSLPGNQTAEDVAKNFINSNANQDGDEIHKLILDPDEYAEILKTYNKSDKRKTVEFTKIVARNQNVPSGKYVTVDFLVQGSQAMEQVYLKNTDQGFKVDITHTFGFGPQTFTQLMVDKPTTGVKFYVWAKFDDFYNFEFSSKQNEYYSIDLLDREKKPTSVQAYLSKDGPRSNEVYNILKDGKSHKMVINLKYPTLRKNSSNSVLVDQIFTIDDWLDVPASERAD